MLVELGLVEQRYGAVLEVLDGVPVTEAAAHAGVTRQTPACAGVTHVGFHQPPAPASAPRDSAPGRTVGTGGRP